MDMTPNENEFLMCTSWNQVNQPLTFDMAKDNFTGRYRLATISIFVQGSSPF